jgi:anti-anti-sigma regulatory factor
MGPEITLYDSNDIIKAGTDYLNSTPRGTLYLDMSNLVLLNSLAIGVLIKLHNLFAKKDRAVVLKNVSRENLKVLESTSLINILRVEADSVAVEIPAEPEESVSLEIDFDIYKDIGIFKFSGAMEKEGDSELYLNTLEKILTDDYKMLVDLSQVLSVARFTDQAVEKLKTMTRALKDNIRIYCSDNEIMKLLKKKNITKQIKVFKTKEDALKEW